MIGLRPGQPILTAKDLGRKFGDRTILKGASFSLQPGDRVGVLGVNGVGKSTLMRILARQDEEYEGYFHIARGATVGYVSQEPELNLDQTVRENVEEAVAEIRALQARYETILKSWEDPEVMADEEKMNTLLAEQGEVQEELEVRNAMDPAALDSQIETAMAALRLPPGDRDVRSLSGGERRRVSLCRELLSHPDVLILDEPTNHLDAETIAWLETFLASYSGTCALVTHDRYFLDRVASRMLEVYHGEIRSYEGNYSDFLAAKEKQQEIQDRTDVNLLKAVSRELEWIRSTPQARRTKSKARIDAYDDLVEKAMRIHPGEELDLRIPFGPRLGSKVLSLRGVTKGFDGKTLFKDFNFDMPPGAIVGVTGANGLGKTTLVNLIVGREQPDAGEVDVGENTRFCYVDQTRQTLRDELTVYDEVADGSDMIEYGDKTLSVRHYLARFLFRGDDVLKPVSELSGGERSRLELALLGVGAVNLLLLDEPTNHLDIPAREALEAFLRESEATLVIVSHDRRFLDRVVRS